MELFGENVERFRPEQRILFRRKNLGFVFQQYNLLPALTAAENAAVPLFAAGMKRREAVAQAKDLLVRLGLENRLDTLPTTLSGGQQQRVALARALVHEPRLILCDEPTAALDHATGEAVMELLVSTAVQPDRAVIVVTHDTRVFHFADTILDRNGKTALSTPDAYADQRKRVEEVFQQEIARGDEPREVAEVVFRALTAPSPRLRYPVRKSVMLSRLRRFVPDRLFDPTFRSQFQLDETESYVSRMHYNSASDY